MAIQHYDTSATPAYVAERLGVDVTDLEVAMAWLDLVAVDGRITGEQSAEVTDLLDPDHSRRVPELHGQADVDWRDDEPVKLPGLGAPVVRARRGGDGSSVPAGTSPSEGPPAAVPRVSRENVE